MAILLLSIFLPSLLHAIPAQSSDVETTPKITVKGLASMGKPAKSLKQTATGILGDSVKGENMVLL